MNVLRRLFLSKLRGVSMLGGFSPWGSWENFMATANVKGFAWKSLIGQEEQGTWVPSLTFNGAASGMTYSQQLGQYVKIGRVVHVHCAITLGLRGSSTGAAVVEGLPFATNASDAAIGIAPVYWIGMASSLVNFTAKVSGTGSTSVDLLGLTSGATELAQLQHDDFDTSGTHFQFFLSYFTRN